MASKTPMDIAIMKLCIFLLRAYVGSTNIANQVGLSIIFAKNNYALECNFFTYSLFHAT